MYKKNILIILAIITLFIIFHSLTYVISWYAGSGMWVDLDKNLVSFDKLDNIIYHDERDILSLDECKDIKNKIIKNKKKWVCKKVVLYTLGGVSYLGDRVGKNNVIESNTFMNNLFPDLYKTLLFNLSSMLNKKVVFREDAYLPGFHIFKSNYLFRYPIAEFHVDYQYTRYKWNNKFCDTSKTISFTLPIDLPKDDSGLYIFNADSTWSRIEASKSKRSLVNYKIGKLVVHSGNNYHIMKPSKILEGEYRITLQGHGVLCNNIWYIFW